MLNNYLRLESNTILTGARANNRPNFPSHGPSCFWRSRVMPLTLRVYILSSQVTCTLSFRVLLEDSRQQRLDSDPPSSPQR